MYIPLGGAPRKLLNIWVVFTFVALWHDLEWYYLLLSMLDLTNFLLLLIMNTFIVDGIWQQEASFMGMVDLFILCTRTGVEVSSWCFPGYIFGSTYKLSLLPLINVADLSFPFLTLWKHPL